MPARASRRNRFEVIVGDNAARRGMNPLYSIFVRLVMCVCCFFGICMVMWMFWNQISSVSAANSFIGDETTPLVVLYHGKPEGAPYEWNTGVWPSWGRHEGDMYNRIIKQKLDWQAEGAIVTKTCDVHCHITHDQALVPHADAVVMELINHYKFFGSDTTLQIPWPKGINGKDPILGMFHYESDSEYEFMTSDPEIMNKIDFTVTPQADSDLPVTLICNWGYPDVQYLTYSPYKVTETENKHLFPDSPVYVADFRGAIPPGYEQIFKEFHRLVNVDSFGGQFRNANAPEPYILSERISHMGKYMFVIIAESIIEDDWICPEFSQALLSGAVPIYFGAPNIDKYLPGEGSIINARDFSSAQDLADYVNRVGADKDEYSLNHMKWKSKPLPESFRGHLKNCTHLAECRMCHKVLELMSNQ